jgi:hypothetical protein
MHSSTVWVFPPYSRGRMSGFTALCKLSRPGTQAPLFDEVFESRRFSYVTLKIIVHFMAGPIP